MTEQTFTREGAEAIRLRSEPERLIELRIMRWGEIAETADSGPETFERGAFADSDPTRVTIEAGGHDGPIVGVGRSLEEREDAAYLTARIAPTPAGDELLVLAAEGVYRDASVRFAERPGGSVRRKGVTTRRRVDLRRVAVLPRGAYPGAAVMAVRSEESGIMVTETEPTPTPVPDPPAPPAPEPDPEPMRLVRHELELMRSELGSLRIGAGGVAVHPLARFAGLGEFSRAAFGDRELARALVDEITSDNPGVVPPAWLSRVVGIRPRRKPAVTAFGRDALPDSGMSFNWPTYTGDIKTLVQKQAAQKTAVHSEKISFGSAQTAIESYGFAHDVAYQLILRSSPSYIEAANRVLLAGFDYYEEAAFTAALLAAPGKQTVVLAIGATADAVRAAFFQASLKVEAATGAPASICLAASDWFAALGGLPGLWPAPYGTANVAGTATASTLSISVSGLTVIHDSFLPAGTLLFSNEEAASYHGDGPRFVTAEDVERLGRNEAIWGMGATAVYIPGGIVVAAATQAAAARFEKGASSSEE